MTPQEFAQKIKQKYPQYQNVDDNELTQRIVQKYPQYASALASGTSPEPVEEKSFLQKAEEFGGKVTSLLGGKNVADTFGAEIAKLSVAPEDRSLIEQPSLKETAGSAIALGSLFTPIGKIAGTLAKGARALGIGEKTANYASKVAAGGSAGALADTGFSMNEGEAHIGLGTALGAGIPVASPLVGAVTRASKRLLGKGVAEIQGALTGTSAETVEQAFNAARKGGTELDNFTEALRGKTTPEALVNTVRQNVDLIDSQNQQLFKTTLAELGDIPIPTAPAKQGFFSKLTEAGIKVTDKGLLDFSESKLKLVPAAQTKLQTAWLELLQLPQEAPLSRIDTTRQAIKALSQAGDDPSANLANKLLDDAVRAVRGAGEKVEGYGAMLDNFGETADFLRQLEKGLSSGDNSTIDQAYRRMTTALKTNNEQRMALVRELDAATGGSILSTIAGQQLSEALPRGIFRQIAAGIAGGAALTGGISSSLIPALVFASPRVTGEFIRSMGIATNKAEAIIRAIGDARNLLIKIGAIGGAVEGASNLEKKVDGDKP